MILVRFENENIRPQAAALWKEAFGDSEEYINFFFDNHSCVCLTQCDNNELCSMLFLIDGELNNIKGCYLFAACTFKNRRGKGYMPMLLERAKKYAEEQGKGFIALVPAENWLFDYYGKFGYKTAFYVQQIDPNEDFKTDKDICFKWCDAHEGYINAESEKYGSELKEKNGMLFTVYQNGKIKIPVERAGEDNRFGMLLPIAHFSAKDFPENAYIGLTLDG